MKQNLKILVLAILVFFSGSAKAQEAVTDLLSIPGPIEYNGTEFFLAWSKQNSKTFSMQQYLPKDETIDDFTQLLNFSNFNKEIDMDLAVRQKVESVQKIMETDKFAEVNVAESPDGTEYIVDYLISKTPKEGESYVEYNVNRFKPFDKNGAKSFLILSYAKRIYGTDFKMAAKTLKKQRDLLITSMIEYQIPEIKLINQSTDFKK